MPHLTLLIAFGAGIASIVSPCVLPIIPSYLSYLTGVSVAERSQTPQTAKALSHGVAFVIGFSTIFLALGWAAGGLGRLFWQYQEALRLVGGAIVVIFGFVTLTGMELPFLERTWRYEAPVKRGRLLGSFFIGLTFAAGWTPCVGPILSAILVLAGTSPQEATALMAAYSAGLALPFLLMAYGIGASSWWRRYSLPIQRLSGVLLVGVGLLLMSGGLDRLAAWLTSTLGYSGI